MMRETLHCRPGKVSELLNRFRELGELMQSMGHEPFRLYTDVAGEQFWTLVLQTEHESLADFMAMEAEIMADERARSIMAGYHDCVLDGRREIFRAVS